MMPRTLGWRTLIIAILIGCAIGWWVNPSRASWSDPRQPAFLTRPCAVEDSVNCYWDASTRGNGQGHSFYSIRYGDCGVIIRYWNRAYGRQHDRQYTDC